MSAASGFATSLAARLLEPPSAIPLDVRRAPLPAALRHDAELCVLDVTKWFGSTSGGVRTYLLEKASHVGLHPELRQVAVVPGAQDLVGEAEGARWYQLRSPRIPRYPPYRLLHAGTAVRRIARHERPDIIEAGSPILVPWLARAAARDLDIPLVAYHHGLLPHNIAPDPARAGIAARGGMHAAWRYLRAIDRFFALTLVGSDFAAEQLHQHGIERTARVPLGVDLELFHPRRRAGRQAVRQVLGIGDDPVVLFVGRFSVEKGLDVLLDAWPAVARRMRATLLLVGDGPLRPQLAARAAGISVRIMPFLHERERLADIVAAADLSVAPGPSETFGLAALEALASGTPVLCPDRGGVAEQVARSGAGSTYAVGMPGSLAEGAVALLQADLRDLGRLGRAYAEREHAWDVVFARLFDVYREVIRRA